MQCFHSSSPPRNPSAPTRNLATAHSHGHASLLFTHLTAPRCPLHADSTTLRAVLTVARLVVTRDGGRRFVGVTASLTPPPVRTVNAPPPPPPLPYVTTPAPTRFLPAKNQSGTASPLPSPPPSEPGEDDRDAVIGSALPLPLPVLVLETVRATGSSPWLFGLKNHTGALGASRGVVSGDRFPPKNQLVGLVAPAFTTNGGHGHEYTGAAQRAATTGLCTGPSVVWNVGRGERDDGWGQGGRRSQYSGEKQTLNTASLSQGINRGLVVYNALRASPSVLTNANNDNRRKGTCN